MKTKNKYLYGWKFLVNYGNGYEYEHFEETREGMLENKNAYLSDCQYPFKIVRGKELNPIYKTNENSNN